MSREVVLVSDEQTSVCDTKVTSDSDKEQSGDSKLEQTLNDNDSVSSVPLIDEDDVPSDFFDDFSNQDFMAGLDIVDAWDDEEEDVKKKSNNEDPVKEVDRGRNETSKRRRSRSPIRFNRNDRRNRRSRDRSRGSRDRDRRRRRKSKEVRVKERESGDDHKGDQRRDPEKTKRDIQKDKDKCAKDKEAQIICEKLKVVETGLVPPGMEMEVDLKQIKSVVREQHKKSEIQIVSEERKKEKGSTTTREELREERKILKEEKVSYREEKFSVREERYTQHDRRRKSRSLSAEFHRNRYLLRNSRGREASYEKRLNRSPYRRRSRSRSPYRRRLSSERRFQLEERKRTNRYRDASPLVIRRTSRGRSYNRSRSRNRSRSNVSEREMWLRKRDYKRDPKTSSSPIGETDFKKYKRNKESFMEELVHILDSEKKKKFLKEIQERINEPVSSPHYPVVPTPLPVPAPVPNPVTGLPPNTILCPPPQPVPVPVPGPGPAYMPNQPQFPFPPPTTEPPPVQYDQQFFIGQPDVFHSNGPYGQPIPPNVSDSIPTSMFSPVPIESPIPINFSQLHNNVDIFKNQKAAEAQKYHQEAVTKLFEDKKISLSDFLSISAKPADTTQPINVQKKVKVISLCQDAIKALGGDSKLNGRFFLKKIIKESEKKEESKYQSPIRKIPVVRFRFTTISKGGEDKSSLQSNLNKLLASLGLIEPPILIKPEDSSTRPESTSTKPASISDKPPPVRRYDPLLGSKYQMKMCQTDPVKCPVCEIRKACKFTNQGVQCDIKTVDTGTQITEEDMIRLGIKVAPVKDALKNQSLAHLTAAQLLAAQEDSPRKDLFSSTRAVSPPPPPNISPDRQNLRHSLSHNDSYSNRSFSNVDNVTKKLPSIFDKIFPNSFENRSKESRPVDSRPIDSRPMDSRPMDSRSMDNRFMDRPLDNRGMDRSVPFENMNTMRPNFESRYESRFESPDFNSRINDYDVEFEPPPNNYNSNQRGFLPPNRDRDRGNNFGSYGGHRY